MALDALRSAMALPAMRRVMLAFGLFRIAEMATWITLLVWAYDRGGTGATAVVAVGQLIPATLAAPLASVLTDRMQRLRGLRLGYLVQAVAHAAAAAVLLLDASFWVVLATAAVAASALTLTRPVHHALVPELSNTPEELTAGNATSTAIEGIADFAGPALAGALLLFAAPGWVFVVMSLLNVTSITMTRGLQVLQVSEDDEEPASYWSDAAEGLRSVVRDPGAATLTSIVTGQFVVLGLLDILAVALAFSVLGTSQAGPGVITSALGIGALIGAGAAAAMFGRRRLGPALAVGLALTSVPLALIAVSPGYALAIVMFALSGIGKATVDVAARTLLQRSVPPRVLARIFGVQEALMMAGWAIGSAIAPLLVALAGTEGAFVATAVVLPAIGAVCWSQVRRLDRSAPSSGTIHLLRSVTMFAALPLPQLEQLAGALRPATTHGDGTVIVRQGEIGHECFVIVEGTVDIERDGVRIAQLGRGDILGEIALLRDVPRTATARARGTVALATLDREPFLLAVTGTDRGYRAADETVEARLADQERTDQERTDQDRPLEPPMPASS